MKKWISIVMMVAMVVTTIMPAASHASMHQHNTAAMEDCHHAASDHAQKLSCDHASKKPCCDKGMCKCPGGNCNGGLAKFFGNSNENLLRFASSQASFGFTQEHTDSALSERLKRPPRA